MMSGWELGACWRGLLLGKREIAKKANLEGEDSGMAN